MDNLIEILRELGIELADDVEDASALTDEQLAEAEAAIVTAFDEATEGTPDLARAESLADAVEAIRAEAGTRLEAAADAEDAVAALRARVTPEATDDAGDGADGGEGDGGDGGGDGSDGGDGDGDAGDGADGTDDAAASDGDGDGSAGDGGTPSGSQAPAVAASATRRAARRMPRSSPARQAPAAPAANVGTIVASAEVQGTNLTPGARITSISDLGEGFAERAHALLRSGKARGRFDLARVTVDHPSDRTLGTDPEENGRRITSVVAAAQEETARTLREIRRMDVRELAEAIEAGAVTADGGLCAPVNVSYDVFGVGDERRPIRDAFSRFGADRGGVRFITPPALADLGGAVGITTADQDADPGSDKPCLVVTCGDETEETVDAVSKCLEIGNFHRRFFREHFDRFWALAGVMHAREAEQNLWTRATAAATQATSGQNLGFFRDFVENLGQLAMGMRSRHRVARTVPVRVVAPEWAIAEASVDLLRQAPGDNTYAVSEAFLRQAAAAHNVALSFTPDVDVIGTQPDGGPLSDWPTEVQVLGYFEGTYLFLDGGMLDFGMEIRDSALNPRNQVQSMTETFEGVAFVGVEAIDLTMTVCPSGEYAAGVDTACEAS